MSSMLLVTAGVLLWSVVSVLAFALCHVAAQGDTTVIEPGDAARDRWQPPRTPSARRDPAALRHRRAEDR